MLGIIIFIVIMAVLGFILAFIFLKTQNPDNANSMVEQINEILPQTQCGQCGFPGCRPYAEAIAKGEAAINQCPPGGQAGIDALANLLNVESIPLSAKNGIEKPKEVAFILENICIGCTLCIQACPVDAILGSAKKMHTIITDECTGCELCVSPCPVDCIVMIKKEAKLTQWIMPIPTKLPIRNRNIALGQNEYQEKGA